MKPSKISVFGNPRIKFDSVPLKILPNLQKRFPQIKFVVEDPTEVIDPNKEDWWIMDTVEGVDDVRIIDDNLAFDHKRRISVHDYDLAIDINLLSKLGKLKKIKIVAVPSYMEEDEAIEKVTKLFCASGF